MKGIKKRLVAFFLSCSVLATAVTGSCQTVGATAVVGPSTAAGIAAGNTLQFLYSVLMSLGITINLKQLINKKNNDIGNWDWGDLLDDPATQGQVDALDKKIGEYYDNAVKDWYVNHGGKITPSPEPTKTPGTSPPAQTSPAPTSIPPDISEKIDSWNEMKKKATQERVFTMTMAAGACLKEAVSKFWDDLIDTDEEFKTDDDNPYSYQDCLGYQQLTYTSDNGSVSSTETIKTYVYDYPYSPATSFYGYEETVKNIGTGQTYYWHRFLPINTSSTRYVRCYTVITIDGKDYGGHDSGNCGIVYMYCNNEYVTSLSEEYHWYIPYSLDGGDTMMDPETKPLAKPAVWVSPNLKKLLDDNKKSPDLPMPISIQLPSLDEIKNFNKDADKSSDDDRPTIVQTFINNHKYSAPDPTQSPDPDPDPTSAPNPDPDPTGSPDATPTPEVTPAVPGDIDVKPTQKPGTGTGTGTGTGGDPSKPDDSGSDFDVDNYKTDLRLVFPFCIPFDLIHLLNVLDAEPEAPRFEIPVDIVVNSPFPKKATDTAMIDYHTTVVVDMSDYEEPIKVIRLFEVIFFILGLMLITRQHMIKG